MRFSAFSFLTVLVMAVAGSTTVLAATPSFDCAKASTAIERLLCALGIDPAEARALAQDA